MPPFKRDAYISNLQRSDAKKIARGIQLTAAADLAIKTSHRRRLGLARDAGL